MAVKVHDLPQSLTQSGAADSALLPMQLGWLAPTPASIATTKRRRIWEIGGNFHCSIIGTCMTTAELRHVLAHTQIGGCHKDSDHELHCKAVRLAGRRDHASKLLQKALDRRHRSVIGQFSKARNAAELCNLWATAIDRAEIPGAYWAVLTHPLATEDLARKAFGDVHMLSHLVGAANRADIRRLRELEIENVGLRDKVARQQSQLRDAVVSRDATIANLTETLSRLISLSSRTRVPAAPDDETTVRLVNGLRRRLTSEALARERLAKRLERVAGELDLERRQHHALMRNSAELQDELTGVEQSLSRLFSQTQPSAIPVAHLAGLTLLYVGGHAHSISQLRRVSEELGASFLHHDGGIDDRGGLLASQVARADRVYFPVDHVSHNAMIAVKRVARQLGKRYIPLRSSGLSSFVLALQREGARQAITPI